MILKYMCLILFNYKNHDKYKLILAGNRDEFYERPTEKATWWGKDNHILSGRDTKSGGTWLGLTKDGKFISVTNYRDPKDMKNDRRSRGEITYNFLTCGYEVNTFAEKLAETKREYNGYNLIFGDVDNIFYFSNKDGGFKKVTEGLHGLSNHYLDTPWKKVEKGKKLLSQIIKDKEISHGKLFRMLADDEKAADNELPSTGVPLDWERVLSPMFIKSESYGTRASTVLLIDYDNNVSFTEKTFLPDGESSTVKFEFKLDI
jgi:uncharacterized protein with NRDE domain